MLARMLSQIPLSLAPTQVMLRKIFLILFFGALSYGNISETGT